MTAIRIAHSPDSDDAFDRGFAAGALPQRVIAEYAQP